MLGGMTATLTPKQIEIATREDRILDAAMPMVGADGAAAINIDRIAKAIGVTRGTVYNHFAHKEDVLVALAARAVGRRMALFDHAAGLGRNPREKVAAIGLAAEVYVDVMPHEFAIEQVIRHDPVWRRSSPGRREVLQRCEQGCIETITRIVARAIATGDLPVGSSSENDGEESAGDIAQQIVFGLWSLVYGGLVIEATSPGLAAAGIDDARQAIRRNCNRLLDRFGWRPLHDRSDYAATVGLMMPVLRQHALTLQSETPR